MLAHPLVAALLLADLLAVVLLAPAAVGAIRVALDWAPERSDAAQRRLDSHAERVSRWGRYAGLCLLVASVGQIVAVTEVLPDLIRGATCGTGVLQALGDRGQRALTLRALAIALLAGWHLVDRLNRADPRGSLTPLGARGLLLATPFVLLAFVDTLRAFWGVDLSQPVGCCAGVYGRARLHGGAQPQPWLGADQWVALSGVATLVLIGLAVRLRTTHRRAKRVGAFLAVVALGWGLFTAKALVVGLAAYHTHVLRHPCPWCLFLGKHYAVGYLIYGAMAVVVLEGLAAFLATRPAIRQAAVHESARTRARQAALRVVVGTLVLWAVAGLPALLWRLRFGTWMG